MKRTLTVLGILLLLASGIASGQFSGAIEGYVKDATGAVIPGAEILVTDENLGLEREASANETGFFRIGELPAGSYAASVASTGFVTWSTTGLLVRSNETRTLYPEMQIGEVTTSITIEADTSAVNTTEVDNTNYIDEESLKNQPLPRNTIWQLSTLVPGVTGTGETSGTNGAFVDNYQGEMGLRINASGQRQGANLVMLNGSYAEVPSRDGTFMVSPIPDSLQEFRVEAQNFSAAKGRSSGAFLELVTKSGTNELHGTLGYLYTNNSLTARTIAQSDITDFAQKNFWATAGGPIKRNKTFVFGAFDFLRASTSTTTVGVAETPEFRSYVTSNFPQSIAARIFGLSPAIDPTSDIITVGQLKQRNPGQFDAMSTIPDSLPAVGTVNSNASVPRQGQQYQIRVDHHFSAKDRLFGYYYKSDGNRQFASLIRPAYTRWSPVLNTWTKFDWNHVFSPTFMNSMGYRYSRQTGEQQAPLGDGAVDVPNIGISGTQGFGAWGPGGWTTPTWEWRDMATLNKGKHTVQFGGEYVRPDDTVPWRKTLTRPTFSFASLLDFAQDRPTSQFGPAVNLASGEVGGAYLSYHTSFIGMFVQDNWRLRPGFSLNLGVRFDNYGEGIRYTQASDQGCYLFAGQGGNAMERITNGFAECRQTATDRLPWMISPRIGFAWDVFSNGSLSIRGGYGMYRDRIAQNWFSTLNLLGPPATATPSLSVLQGDELTYGLGNWGELDALAQDASPDIWPKPNVTYELNERGGVQGLRSSILSVDQNMRIPTAHSWMLSLQKRLGPDSMAEVNYTGSADHNLTVHSDINRFAGDLLDGRLDRLNPFFGAVQRRWTGANSNAHLLSLMFHKRHTRGLSMRAVYTYAKVLDHFSTSGLPQASVPSTPVFDVWNLRAQRGRADFDVRQRLTFDAMWEVRVAQGSMPAGARAVINGWRFGTVGVMQSGLPFTVLTSAPYPAGDFNADGLTRDLPDAPAFGNSLSGLARSDYLSGIFQASDFPLPTSGQQGNLGRNTFSHPGLLNVSLLISRTFKLPMVSEATVLQIRGEIFNVINRANLDRVVNNMTSGLFGRVTNSIGPRSAQLGMRFQF